MERIMNKTKIVAKSYKQCVILQKSYRFDTGERRFRLLSLFP